MSAQNPLLACEAFCYAQVMLYILADCTKGGSMSTEELTGPEAPQISDAFADAWAAVFIDVYEKLKANGELPEDDATPPEVACSAT
jgi:hypothetical protein